MLTNRVLSSEEALDWGIVTQVVADDALMEEAEKLAKQFATGPTQAFGSVKKLLLATFDNSLETQMELETITIANMGDTNDGKEGMTAFLEKRKPQYKGC